MKSDRTRLILSAAVVLLAFFKAQCAFGGLVRVTPELFVTGVSASSRGSGWMSIPSIPLTFAAHAKSRQGQRHRLRACRQHRHKTGTTANEMTYAAWLAFSTHGAGTSSVPRPLPGRADLPVWH